MPDKSPTVAVLAEGRFGYRNAKTAIGILRYAPYGVAAVIDSTRAGTDAADHVAVPRGTPIVATLADAVARGADTLVVGTAAPGGRIADEDRPVIHAALESGMSVWSGLHERVLDDPALADAARRGNATVRELREPPATLDVGGHGRRRAGVRVILTVGSDAAVGKMTAALELVAALRRAGEHVAFVATGQTGIAIAGQGISVDAVIADFIAGAAEQMVCDAAEQADWVIVEGQGSLAHPGFSGVTLGLLHGSAPDAMVLCHEPRRRVVKGYETEELPVTSLEDCIRMYEDAAAWRHPREHPRARIVAIALNTAGVDDAGAARERADAEARTKLPAADLVREGAAGAERIVAALRAAFAP